NALAALARHGKLGRRQAGLLHALLLGLGIDVALGVVVVVRPGGLFDGAARVLHGQHLVLVALDGGAIALAHGFRHLVRWLAVLIRQLLVRRHASDEGLVACLALGLGGLEGRHRAVVAAERVLPRAGAVAIGLGGLEAGEQLVYHLGRQHHC